VFCEATRCESTIAKCVNINHEWESSQMSEEDEELEDEEEDEDEGWGDEEPEE
jgi:hypothetical protein